MYRIGKLRPLLGMEDGTAVPSTSFGYWASFLRFDLRGSHCVGRGSALAEGWAEIFRELCISLVMFLVWADTLVLVMELD
mmetsp:Transcript_22648/g.22849  ORF Transcript_22648/g.22849 Transcript_22648/m.22849 type:complete len:80 (+) Transcript_22648:307-546(+)